MAGRGPAGKETLSRERDERRRAESFTIVSADGSLHGPDLPDGFEWPDQTVAWWETWRKSAQAKTFTDTDWSFLIDTAVMHAEFWLGNRALAPELRLRVAKFGATPEDRMRLKIAVGEPAGPAKPKLQTKASQNRRARLLKAVGDGED